MSKAFSRTPPVLVVSRLFGGRSGGLVNHVQEAWEPASPSVQCQACGGASPAVLRVQGCSQRCSGTMCCWESNSGRVVAPNHYRTSSPFPVHAGGAALAPVGSQGSEVPCSLLFRRLGHFRRVGRCQLSGPVPGTKSEQSSGVSLVSWRAVDPRASCAIILKTAVRGLGLQETHSPFPGPPPDSF